MLTDEGFLDEHKVLNFLEYEPNKFVFIPVENTFGYLAHFDRVPNSLTYIKHPINLEVQAKGLAKTYCLENFIFCRDNTTITIIDLKLLKSKLFASISCNKEGINRNGCEFDENTNRLVIYDYSQNDKEESILFRLASKKEDLFSSLEIVSN